MLFGMLLIWESHVFFPHIREEKHFPGEYFYLYLLITALYTFIRFTANA